MELVLEKDVNITYLNVRGVILIPKKMDYFLPILQHIKEMKSSRTNEKLLSENLLGNENIEIAKSLLSQCEYLELLKKNNQYYDITDKGNTAIQEEMFFVPQEGTWQISFAIDIMFPGNLQILEIKPTEIELYRNKNTETNSRQHKNEMINLPASLIKLKKIRVKRIDDNDVIIGHIEGKAEKLKLTKGRIKWNPGGKSFTFSENTIDKFITIPFSNFTSDQIWKELLESKKMYKNWNKDNQKLSVNFDRIPEQERIQMKQALVFKKPKLFKCGIFNDVKCSVDIWPQTKNDAQKWAEFLFYHKITQYVTEENYKKWNMEIKEKFSDYDIQIKERSMLISNEYVQKHKNVFWYLHAMEDWNL